MHVVGTACVTSVGSFTKVFSDLRYLCEMLRDRILTLMVGVSLTGGKPFYFILPVPVRSTTTRDKERGEMY